MRRGGSVTDWILVGVYCGVRMSLVRLTERGVYHKHCVFHWFQDVSECVLPVSECAICLEACQSTVFVL